LNIYHLYSNSSECNYTYYKGINWRAYAAYVCGILPNVVGFAGAIGRDVPVGATYIYNISYLSGFFTSFIIYCLMVKISPVPGMPVKNFLRQKGWYEEYLSENVENFNEEINQPHPNDYETALKNRYNYKYFNLGKFGRREKDIVFE
jgi:NCS1 family nucleobase:cation symporter-1